MSTFKTALLAACCLAIPELARANDPLDLDLDGLEGRELKGKPARACSFSEEGIPQYFLDRWEVTGGGTKLDSYVVTSADGQILTLYRIKCMKNKKAFPEATKGPALLIHGGTTDAESYTDVGIDPERPNWAVSMANDGYDVWFYNQRGKPASKAKTSGISTAFNSQEFWDFDLDKIAELDIPAVIESILDTRRAEGAPDLKLTLVGDSNGAPVSIKALSNAKKPEYYISQAILRRPCMIPNEPFFIPGANFQVYGAIYNLFNAFQFYSLFGPDWQVQLGLLCGSPPPQLVPLCTGLQSFPNGAASEESTRQYRQLLLRGLFDGFGNICQDPATWSTCFFENHDISNIKVPVRAAIPVGDITCTPDQQKDVLNTLRDIQIIDTEGDHFFMRRQNDEQFFGVLGALFTNSGEEIENPALNKPFSW